MTRWDDGIAGVHLDIASSQARRIGVLAGPGTGKTTYGLMRRVARLLDEGIPGHRILLLSFTRVAAADLRDKIEALEVPGSDQVRATTLHGYCFGLLQRDAVLQLTGRVPRILMDHERDLMLRDIGGEFGGVRERRTRLEAMVASWAREPNTSPDAQPTSQDRDFGLRVERWLRRHQAMLIGEVVPLAYRYLRGNPAVAELQAFDHVIVDEYQDLNSLEQQLLELIAGDGALCIAGDDDQSIYSVRYANPAGILDFMARPDVEQHEIGVCGRCPEVILAMANSVIDAAPERVKPPLVARQAAGRGSAAIVQWQTADDEMDGVVAAVSGDIASGSREPGDILILTNWRLLGERIREELEKLEIPARSFFTQEELSSEPGREALALLRLAANSHDAVALRVLLGLGDATGRSAAYQRVLARCYSNDESPEEVLHQLAEGADLGLNVRAIVGRYVAATRRAHELSKLQLADLIDALLPVNESLTADLRRTALDIQGRVATISELVSELVSVVTQDEVPQQPDFVRVMSLHKSKGLTSPSVYVVGAMHGILPTLRDDSPTSHEVAVAEGRRLFYVAVTRAAEELVISSSISMRMRDARARGVRYVGTPVHMNGVLMVNTIASPYIAELGEHAPKPVRGEVWLASRKY